MTCAAIIAEFNPLHKGHEYLLSEARNTFGADYVLVLMSGDYVQRGTPAVTDRYIRTAMALSSGADCVISYPTRFATSSAEAYAEHAVSMLSSLGVVDMLLFGSESGDINAITETAEVLAEEPRQYRDALQRWLRAGLSFPRARAAALPHSSELLLHPNNILAIEYVKAIIRTHSDIRPVTVTRKGAGHSDAESIGASASSSAIRNRLIACDGIDPAVRDAMSRTSYRILLNDMETYGAVTEDDLSLLLAERIWSAQKPSDLTKYDSVSDTLARTFLSEREAFISFSDFAAHCKSKSVTRTHINRALLHIALGLERRYPLELAPYAHVLGFREEASDLISRLKRSADIPVLLRPGSEARAMKEEARLLFEEETRVSNLYNILRAGRAGLTPVNTLSRRLIVAKN